VTRVRDARVCAPDGRWLTFQSDDSGQMEVFVRPFPDVDGGRWQIWTEGGADPTWGSDGSELFYLAGRRMMAAPIRTDPSFDHGRAEVLFEGDYFFGRDGRNYDVAPERPITHDHGDESGRRRPTSGDHRGAELVRGTQSACPGAVAMPLQSGSRLGHYDVRRIGALMPRRWHGRYTSSSVALAWIWGARLKTTVRPKRPIAVEAASPT